MMRNVCMSDCLGSGVRCGRIKFSNLKFFCQNSELFKIVSNPGRRLTAGFAIRRSICFENVTGGAIRAACATTGARWEMLGANPLKICLTPRVASYLVKDYI